MLSLAVPTEAKEGEKGGQMGLPFDSASELSGLDDDDSWLNAEKAAREEDSLSRPATMRRSVSGTIEQRDFD
jgi:uncharacterized protein involved in type VI secretion and phage assembly